MHTFLLKTVILFLHLINRTILLEYSIFYKGKYKVTYHKPSLNKEIREERGSKMGQYANIST